MRISIIIVQRTIQKKLNFFYHIWQMQDDRLIKQVVFGTIHSKNKRRRPKIWTNDLVYWCNKDIGTLYRPAMDRTKCTHFVKYVMDTNNH